MKVTLLTGFLGAGKTTTLKRILREHGAAEQFGVIVNDLSELEVDGELIRNGDLVSEKNGTLVSLTNGSISDRNREGFHAALRRMQTRGLPHVLIEASGGADPAVLIEDLAALPGIALHAVIALVDARALLHDYEGGARLARPSATFAERLLVGQLATASVIALSKTDLVDGQPLETMLRALGTLNSAATLTACTYGKLDARFLLAAPRYDLPSLRSRRNGRHTLTPAECDIGTDVIRDSRPFHPQRFYELYRDRLGLGIFRSKGFLWFASRPDDAFLWNQSGGTMGLEWLGTWRASILNDPRLLREERELLEQKLATAHPLFGDRDCELTIIGTSKDREIFTRELAACFCTEEEVSHWQRGKPFPDPWPKNIKTLV